MCGSWLACDGIASVQLLHRGACIAGKPGSGRTALAAQLAAQVAESYPDGILRARLTEPDGTPVPTEATARELLTALGLSAPPGADADDPSEATPDDASAATSSDAVVMLELAKRAGETIVVGQEGLLDRPRWTWP